MKLICCHIENFGKLSDATFSFSDGCNWICEENGWGKSTLAAFIKVMLFGFDNSRKRDETENERKRYRPWQGGVYGGQMTFEADGVSYTIERVFAATEKEDLFRLRQTDTNKESNAWTEHIGEELFHLDSASFAKTIYISQNDCRTAATDKIYGNLGNLAEHTDDMNCFDEADERLKAALNRLTPDKKTGLLAQKRKQIREMETEVKRGASLEVSVRETLRLKNGQQEKCEELDRQSKKLQEEQKTLSAYKDIQVKKERYAALCEECDRRRQEAEEAGKHFPGEIPSEEDINHFLSEAYRLNTQKASVVGYRLTSQEKERKDCLMELFGGSLPQREEIEACRRHIREWEEKKLSYAQYQFSEEERDKLHFYERQFRDGVPTEKELNARLEQWKRRTEVQNVLASAKAKLQMLKKLEQESGENKLSVSVAAGIILLAAAVLVVWFLPLLGLVSLAVGVFLLAIGLLDKKKKKIFSERQKEEGEADRYRQEIFVSQKFLADSEADMRQLLKRYGLPYEEHTALETFLGLKYAADEYRMLIEKQSRMRAEAPEQEIRRLEEKIRAFLGCYKEKETAESVALGQFADALYWLEAGREEYLSLAGKQRNYEEAEKFCKELSARLAAYIESLSMEVSENIQEQLQQIGSYLQEYLRCRQEWRQAQDRKEVFEERNKDCQQLARVLLPKQSRTLGEISEELGDLKKQYEQAADLASQYGRQVEELLRQRDACSRIEEQLETAKEDWQKEKMYYDRLKMTRELLTRAKESLVVRYMEPIRKGFEKYYQILSGTEARGYHLDVDMRLTVDGYGRQRSTELLSAGMRDLTGICMRMALIDAMYNAEKPFVIFDDPFVNLDQDKVKGGLAFLKEIAQEYQVIYFTCHESRIEK